VIEALEVVLPMIIFDRENLPCEIDVVLDTGRTAFLTLPQEVILALQLRRKGRETATIADGQVIDCEMYVADVLWHGRKREVEVVELDMVPMIGMRLLEGSRVHFTVVDGGDVHVAPATVRPRESPDV
jgi:clan AA aspartic protease